MLSYKVVLPWGEFVYFSKATCTGCPLQAAQAFVSEKGGVLYQESIPHAMASMRDDIDYEPRWEVYNG